MSDCQAGRKIVHYPCIVGFKNIFNDASNNFQYSNLIGIFIFNCSLVETSYLCSNKTEVDNHSVMIAASFLTISVAEHTVPVSGLRGGGSWLQNPVKKLFGILCFFYNPKIKLLLALFLEYRPSERLQFKYLILLGIASFW